jgi:hypothetical protein
MRNGMLVAMMRRPTRVAAEQFVELLRCAPTDADARRAVCGVLWRLPQACAARRRVGDDVEGELTLLEHAPG